MAHLSKAQLPNMKRLGLYCNHISLHGIRFLIKGNWKNLNHMNMRTSLTSQNTTGYWG